MAWFVEEAKAEGAGRAGSDCMRQRVEHPDVRGGGVMVIVMVRWSTGSDCMRQRVEHPDARGGGGEVGKAKGDARDQPRVPSADTLHLG